MIAYELYWHDPIKGYQRIGLLPERRNNPARITEGSIINWGERFFGAILDINGIFLHPLKIDENTGRTSCTLIFPNSKEESAMALPLLFTSSGNHQEED
jgi:hypothetical protein